MKLLKYGLVVSVACNIAQLVLRKRKPKVVYYNEDGDLVDENGNYLEPSTLEREKRTASYDDSPMGRLAFQLEKSIFFPEQAQKDTEDNEFHGLADEIVQARK